jgi:hypothetical protein
VVFDVVFAVFAAAMVVVAVLAVRWAVLKDRVARRDMSRGGEPSAGSEPRS